MASAAATTMASQTHLLSLSQPYPFPLLSPLQHRHRHSQSHLLHFSRRSCSVSLNSRHFNPPTASTVEPTPSPPPLLGSTRTVTTLFGFALLFLKTFQKLPSFTHSSGISISASVGPLFFASLQDRPGGYLNTPLTVVAAGLGKWLDIYSGVLMVRVLLSWFPNIPWERQPLCAIRDLCDPYLNLFRNIIPPVFDTLDVSPLLAFAVLGVLGSILHTAMA